MFFSFPLLIIHLLRARALFFFSLKQLHKMGTQKYLSNLVQSKFQEFLSFFLSIPTTADTITEPALFSTACFYLCSKCLSQYLQLICFYPLNHKISSSWVLLLTLKIFCKGLFIICPFLPPDLQFKVAPLQPPFQGLHSFGDLLKYSGKA